MKQKRIVKHWYIQTGSTCPTYGLMMLFSYLTNKKYEVNQFIGTNKNIINILKDGDLGCRATITNIKKTTISDFLLKLKKNPLACDITQYEGVDYNQLNIPFPKNKNLKATVGHRMLFLDYNPELGRISFANSSGLEKIQTMDFAFFWVSYRKALKLTIIDNKLKKITPLKQTNPKWSRIKMGKSNYTLGAYGCLTICICMAMERLRGYAANPIDAAKNWNYSKDGYLSWNTKFKGIEYNGKFPFILETIKNIQVTIKLVLLVLIHIRLNNILC